MSIKKSSVLLTVLSIVIISSAAFLIDADDRTEGAEVTIGEAGDPFTYVYDDSGSLNMDGNPSTKEVKLKSYNWNADHVAIPDSIVYNSETYLVTVVGTGAFNQKTHMEVLSIGNNVKLIESSAFRECTGLKKLDLKNVTEVQYQAFMHCTSLTEMTADNLEIVGPYAFSILDVINQSPYTGDIPFMEVLSLPKVLSIGEGAFGAKLNYSFARDFGTVSLPVATTIGDYAFSQSKIDISLSIPKAQVIGDSAFYLSATSGSDTSEDGYALSITEAVSIGGNAFTGRAITLVSLPATTSYSIDSYAFAFTKIQYAELGMVNSVAVTAFNNIHELEYFLVSSNNTKYASIISSDPSAVGVKGALYSYNGSDIDRLYKLPAMIRPLLADYNNRFTVADGVTQVYSLAFERCPSIAVDLNDVTTIPMSAFSNSEVVRVNARNVDTIRSSAFANCSGLTSFTFLTTGGSLTIDAHAFNGTSLAEVYLPRNTTMGEEAFANIHGMIEVLGIWGDTAINADSLSNTKIDALQVSSDAATAAGAKNIYDNWNASGWKYGESSKIRLLMINNIGNVDISGLVPDGQGYIQIMNYYDLQKGSLQFVEYKEKKIPPFHMMSVKNGIYSAETHGSSTSQIDIMTNVQGNVDSGENCYQGDGRTWELVHEYYQIVFYSFDTNADSNGNSINDGEDPDYINTALGNTNVSDRIRVGDGMYLAQKDLKSLRWQTFVRYSLEAWYIADDPDHMYATTIDKSNRVTAGDAFGRNISESWIYRDPITDQGILNLYAVFIGKEYKIETESRVTGGQTSTITDTDPNSAGGEVELILSEAINGSTGFSTGSTGFGSDSYPFGTEVTIYAKPKPGYAFVGWAVISLDEGTPIFEVKNDRSYVQNHGTASWNFVLPSQLKYVAYFAKTTEVTFDDNDGSPTDNVIFVVGDRLVEAENDYNGRDYAALVNKATESLNTGNGTSYYVGTPTQSDLDFGGWYSGTTRYAEFDPTDLANPGTDLKNLSPMPNVTSITLKAKWYAVITFYPDDGVNDANLSGTGLTETAPSSGIYNYNHDVGTYISGTGYNGVFNYGTNYSPTISDLIFNGWYVLNNGSTFSDIVAVSNGTNATTPYPDVYGTKKRLEPGTVVAGHMSLMALYVAEVEFYFNEADGVASSVASPTPYSVMVPASTPTLLGDAYFNTLNLAMQNADSIGETYKFDTGGNRMLFMGWYVSNDGSTSPVSTDVMYGPTTTITNSVKLIAGWGITVSFSNGGTPSITDVNTSMDWIPGNYGFVVLQGTIFDTTHADMPDVMQGSKVPTSWYDKETSPYTWYTDSITAYTYSVTLIPEFKDLFQFNMMGGNLGTVYVAYSSSETFQEVLDRLFESLYNNVNYLEITKSGLYYQNDGTIKNPGEKPNAIWYKDDGDPTTDHTTNPSIVYVGANEADLVKWNPSDLVGTDIHAYIRWMADVSFDRNVPDADVDAGTSAHPQKITGVDEGTPFSSLSSMVQGSLTYNTANDKTFKGWYEGAVKYSDPDGTPAIGAPNVTGNLTLLAKWSVEVKFYYTGSLSSLGGTTGIDGIGTYVIIEVGSNNKVGVPSLTKAGFTSGHLLWYDNGIDGIVPINISGFTHSDAPESFDITQDIFVNKVLYGRWYADVEFDLSASNSSGFFTSLTKYLLEGSKLSEINEDLDPFVNDVQKSDWNFVGWFDNRTATSSYEDLGIQYYRTSFDYLPNDGITPTDSTSVHVTGNVKLASEYVVLVDFDSGYEPGESIDSQYLRVTQPIPDITSPRFTAKPTRSDVTFMGWFDTSNGKKHTADVRDSDSPNTEMVMRSMTLRAAWLVTVSFHDLEGYRINGLQFALTSTIIQYAGTDGIMNTNDDYFEMAEGTSIRQFITVDPTVNGKTFISWFVEQGTPNGLYDDGDILYGLNDRITSDIVLSAGYGFVIHFDTKGGTPSTMADRMVIEGQALVLPEKPSKGSLTFEGWNDGSITTAAGQTVIPTSETTYSAKWIVVVKMYDGISSSPVISMQWYEEDGPSFIYCLTTSPDYDNNIVTVTIRYTDITGTHEFKVEKFIDRYDTSINDWVSLYSVFDGWFDPLTGEYLAPTDDLSDMFSSGSDSHALLATWKERVRFYEGNSLLKSEYVNTGTYLSAEVPNMISGWSDIYSPTVPLNPDTYRIINSTDFLEIGFITVTFDANGGSPSQQVFSNIVSGTMIGAIGPIEPIRSGMYFSGWYDGNTRFSFTDKVYGDITLVAKWDSVPVDRHTIFATAHSNAHISPEGMIRALDGDRVSFDFYVDKGYTLELFVDGIQVQTDRSSYTFDRVNKDHLIEVRAVHTDSKEAIHFLTVDCNGRGEVLYSKDGGATFISYSSPFPLYEGVEYILKAVPFGTSYFDRWSGDLSGTNPEMIVSYDGNADVNVTANFGSATGAGFGSGSMGILNMICVILSLAAGIIVLTFAYKRNYEGTGVGKSLRMSALLVGLISVVLFLMTQGFSGSYIPYDEWTLPMGILLAITLILSAVSFKYDYDKKEQ